MSKNTTSKRRALLQRIAKREFHPEIPRGFVGYGEGYDTEVKPIKPKQNGTTEK